SARRGCARRARRDRYWPHRAAYVADLAVRPPDLAWDHRWRLAGACPDPGPAYDQPATPSARGAAAAADGAAGGCAGDAGAKLLWKSRLRWRAGAELRKRKYTRRLALNAARYTCAHHRAGFDRRT